ncbi:MAG TPA: T9SS type A sorting domain-containing protein [Flavobacteriaceae bacterium]|nr:T9SS type A sorting domain-containing protein [Flavobacteriaceae bacterium]
MNSKTILRFFQYFLIFSLFAVPFQAFAQINGCTDPLSLNYNPEATVNDGSCSYLASGILPLSSFPLESSIHETSGLIFWNGKLWTHNDNDDTNLYALSPSDGSILETYSIPSLTNTDWEAISQDENYIYIGDFGNNSHGNRTDLKIYRISKSSLLSGTLQVDVINFSYENQTDFSDQEPNTTNFDCEAFIISANEIFLFTKQWQGNNTAIYSLSKTPGTQIAQFEATLNTNGMITDATFMETERLAVLSGYTPMLQPFLFLLYDFQGTNFLSGNKRKINLNLPFFQTEAIATQNGQDYYISNEYFNFNGSLEIPQQLHKIDLSDYLGNYLNNLNIHKIGENNTELSFYPNPTESIITLESEFPLDNADYLIFDELGRKVLHGKLNSERTINLSELKPGLYFLKLFGNQEHILKLIKK